MKAFLTMLVFALTICACSRGLSEGQMLTIAATASQAGSNK